jgi:small subunit ribosomal protein S8
MAVTDPVADMLTKIRNASQAKFDRVDILTSKIKLEVIKILKNEGYVKNFKKISQDGANYIRVFLKYDTADEPIIKGIQKISKPGRRVYSGYRKMPRIYNGYGTLIVSTPSGVTTGRKAVERKVGGELICSVW